MTPNIIDIIILAAKFVIGVNVVLTALVFWMALRPRKALNVSSDESSGAGDAQSSRKETRSPLFAGITAPLRFLGSDHLIHRQTKVVRQLQIVQRENERLIVQLQPGVVKERAWRNDSGKDTNALHTADIDTLKNDLALELVRSDKIISHLLQKTADEKSPRALNK